MSKVYLMETELMADHVWRDPKSHEQNHDETMFELKMVIGGFIKSAVIAVNQTPKP